MNTTERRINTHTSKTWTCYNPIQKLQSAVEFFNTCFDNTDARRTWIIKATQAGDLTHAEAGYVISRCDCDLRK